MLFCSHFRIPLQENKEQAVKHVHVLTFISQLEVYMGKHIEEVTYFPSSLR